MARQERGGGGFGTLLVFAAGVACGLLFARQPGDETREQLADLFHRGKRKAQDLMNKTEELPRQAEKAVEGAKEAAKEPFYESGKYT